MTCLMCHKPAAAQPHLYPGPVRTWQYAPTAEEGPMQDVELHTPCVGSFLVMNRDKKILIRLKPE